MEPHKLITSSGCTKESKKIDLSSNGVIDAMEYVRLLKSMGFLFFLNH